MFKVCLHKSNESLNFGWGFLVKSTSALLFELTKIVRGGQLIWISLFVLFFLIDFHFFGCTMSHGFYFVLGDFHGNSWVGCAKAVHNHNPVVPALIGNWLFCFVILSLLCCLKIFLMIFCFFCHFFWYRSLGISWDFISKNPFFFVGKVGFSLLLWLLFLKIFFINFCCFLAVSFFSVILAFFGLFPLLIFSFVGLCGVVVYGIVCLIWFLESFFFLFK